jgi:glycosyltransferase involved in cell wall biosynthesis
MASALHLIDRQIRRDQYNQLARLVRPGEPVVSLGAPPAPAETPLSVTAISRPMGPLLSLSRPVRDLLSGPEALCVWSAPLATALAAAAGRAGKPMVAALHHLPAPGGPRRLFARQIGRHGFIAAVPSDAAAAALAAYGAPRDSVVHLPPAADPAAPEDRGRVRQRLGLGDGDRLLVAPDEMLRPAGHRLAIWAYSILRHITPRSYLAIPAGGPDAEFIRRFALATGFGPEILLADTTIRLSSLLGAADIVLLFHERDFGIAALVEAMAAARPIIAACLAGLGELAPHEQAALLVDPKRQSTAAGALLRMIEEPGLADRLAGEAAARAKPFSVERSRAALDEAMEKARAARLR